MEPAQQPPTPPPTPQGPIRGGGDLWLPPLAGGDPAQDQAEAFWCPPPLPPGDPRRANQERCGFGLCVEGGDTRPWDPIPPGWGAEQGGGLDSGQEFGDRGPLLGDRLWRDAQVRRLWELDLTTQSSWEWEEIDYDWAC